jgi:hypothetical protein
MREQISQLWKALKNQHQMKNTSRSKSETQNHPTALEIVYKNFPFYHFASNQFLISYD